MQFRTAAVVALALLVLLAGCGGFGGPEAEDTDDETGADETDETETDTETDDNETGDAGPGEESNDTETEDDESDGNETAGLGDDNETDDNESDNETDGLGDDNESVDEPDDNESDDGLGDDADGSDENETEEEWSEPEPPNTPMEDKKEDRISSVTFVDRVPEDGSDGYSNFNLEVVANTSMESIDPADHGDVRGEPYFMVKVNGELIERTDVVAMEEEGEFHIQVRRGGLERFEPGELDVSVWLMDRDSEWDDVYDTWEGEIQYDPDAGESGDEEGDGTEGEEANETEDEETNETEDG